MRDTPIDQPKLEELLLEESSHWNLSHTHARAFSLACVLEPCSNKTGCVTRFADYNKNTLEMFLTGGVNLFSPLIDLCQYARHEHSNGFYSYLPRLVLASKMSRCGGQINTGILEFGLPIVAASVQLQNANVPAICEKAQELVDNTSKADVANLIRAKYFAQAITQFGRGKKYELNIFPCKNVKEFYSTQLQHELSNGAYPTGVLHNKQFVSGFEDIHRAYNDFMHTTGRLAFRCEQTYTNILRRHTGIGPGLAADWIAIVLYLGISNGKIKEIS